MHVLQNQITIMKKLTVIIFTLIIASSMFAQGKYGKDSAECVKYLSYYSEYMKQNNLEEAAPSWRKAMSLCPPTANQNLLINGQKILRFEINKNRNNPVRKQELLDSLIMLHDIRAQYYKKYKVSSLDNKAKDIINFNCYVDNPKKQYEVLTVIIDAISSNCSPVVYVKQMQVAVDLYKQGLLSAEEVMNNYTHTIECMDVILEDDSKTNYADAKKDVESLFMESGVASCDNLLTLYAPRYEANPNDKELLSSMVQMLGSSNCIETELFLKSVASLYAIEPSASSAYYLYKLYSSKDQNELAAKSLEEAISLTEETNTAQLASYYFELATFYFKKLGRNVSAIGAAKKAVELDASLEGKSYLLIGTIWGAQKCGGNEVESRAQYWVAVDYMTKARNADASLADEANALANQYRKYFPQQAEAFMYDVMDGAAYTVSCQGMRETTTVRTQK